MSGLSRFEISLKGLEKGLYNYEFKIGPAFFNAFEEPVEEVGEFQIQINLDKRTELMTVDFDVQGLLKADCDRCLARIKLPISSNNQLILKYEADEEFDDENVVILDKEASKFNFAPYILENILFAIPIVRSYDCENESTRPCDEKVLAHLDNTDEKVEDGGNPFKDLLKDIDLNN